MNELQLYKLLFATLRAGFESQGIPIQTKRSFNNTKAALPDKPTITIHKIATDMVGWQSNTSTNKGKTGNAANMLRKFQVTAVVKSDLNPKEDQLTSSDYLEYALMFFQSNIILDKLREVGCNVMRVSSITPNAFLNESDDWEDAPFFTLEVAVKREFETPLKIAEFRDTLIYDV